MPHWFLLQIGIVRSSGDEVHSEWVGDAELAGRMDGSDFRVSWSSHHGLWLSQAQAYSEQGLQASWSCPGEGRAGTGRQGRSGEDRAVSSHRHSCALSESDPQGLSLFLEG